MCFLCCLWWRRRWGVGCIRIGGWYRRGYGGRLRLRLDSVFVYYFQLVNILETKAFPKLATRMPKLERSYTILLSPGVSPCISRQSCLVVDGLLEIARREPVPIVVGNALYRMLHPVVYIVRQEFLVVSSSELVRQVGIIAVRTKCRVTRRVTNRHYLALISWQYEYPGEQGCSGSSGHLPETSVGSFSSPRFDNLRAVAYE